ncbi:uncharacterized protein LOC132312386 [Cornus florida]|uniref:uncharacterized protein LOC132312386 n=1 Tax=Cornus florida TaxID=4283 RepID=UPI00289A8697|nr:uncharacterized protein LOC132312386 [Cornus florida]XP_059666719.1 uncharacterized protein LOC132312386 [Cornus florida]XP_059666720.1 uncharacterized protein LOC132312386 [Cornus florida]XP_059666721.1 uncharacterized protein LOC132312386 [Cornus florida]XP_059666723.1 uncharacterized protein LOC132312386 [Cornus florida]
MMEQSKNYNNVQYDSMGSGNEQLESTSWGFLPDSTSYTNANMKPPELNVSEAKPVLNFSIQTGEEFSLEFMRERVNPRKPLVPNTANDPRYMTGYMDLKGILGISHTGSESGSDISMLSVVGKGSKEFERKNSSLYEDRNNYGSMQSVPRTSSDYNSNRGIVHEYASSGASDSSSTKIKVLCSFGGKILPRPSDGRLRYVGGETRIIRIGKDITWQELWRKTVTVYNQTHTIKYQLPGEDLDALVSVSCDEDLQNMMEECSVLEDGEGSKKLRMFLFSMSDLDDSQYGLGSTDGDSEVQYVVAVNGMDMGSRKNSTLHGLASSSGNNLNELEGQNVEGNTGRVASEFVGIGSSPLTGFTISSSTTQYSQPIQLSSSNAYENHPQFYRDQLMHHGATEQYDLHYGYDPRLSNRSPFGESSVPQPVDGLMTHQGGVNEGQLSSGLYAHETQMHVKEVKLQNDGLVQQEVGRENVQPSDKNKDYPVQSHPYDGNVMDYFSGEEASIVVPRVEGEFPLKSPKNEGRHQEAVQISLPLGAVNPAQVPKSDDNDCNASSSAFAPGYTNSESDPIDSSYLEPPVPAQRIFHSERIPREQADLRRLTKSDDSLGSQFLINHTQSDAAQQDFISESGENLQNGTPVLQTEQAISTAKPLHTDPQNIADGLPQLQKLKQAILNPVDEKYALNEDKVVKGDHGATSTKDNDKNLLVDAPSGTGSRIPVVSQLASVDHNEDHAHNLADLDWGGRSDGDFTTNRTPPHAQPSSWIESSTGDVSTGKTLVGTKAEQGDILIDINDRFPRDFLSDIFSKAILSEDSSGNSPLQKDGAGLSMNIENLEPQHWSFFQKLARDEFARKDVSLIDQDHLGFSSGLPKVEEEAPMSYKFMPSMTDGITLSHVDSQIYFGEDNQKELSGTIGADTIAVPSDYSPSVKESEAIQFDGFVENRLPESEYEDGFRNVGLPPLDPSLGEFDLSSLQIIKNEDLEELKELGSGTFGTVYHGKWRGTDVAIKRIKKSCFTGRSSEQERLTIEFWREAEILSKLHHPNVVAFYGVVQDGPGGTLATVAEYMVDGSLRHVLLRKDRHLDRRKRLIIAMDAAFGMEYLHSKNIVHFDLKCDNLLVNLKDPSRPICKVADFGLSKIKRNTLVSGGVRGTLPWMAPELLNGSSNKVSEKVDVFSFGIVLWEILTGEEPYANMHYGAIIGGIVSNTLRPSIPSFCDIEWRTLMEQCWAPNPAARPSFTEIASRLRVMSSAAIQTKTHVHKASN